MFVRTNPPSACNALVVMLAHGRLIRRRACSQLWAAQGVRARVLGTYCAARLGHALPLAEVNTLVRARRNRGQGGGGQQTKGPGHFLRLLRPLALALEP